MGRYFVNLVKIIAAAPVGKRGKFDFIHKGVGKKHKSLTRVKKKHIEKCNHNESVDKYNKKKYL